MLLQISLLLFLVGVIQFLWTLDRTVAMGQLVLSAAGLAVYMVTIIIGIIVPTSPFQTPLSRYLPKTLDRLHRGLKSLILNSASQHWGDGTWITRVTAFLDRHDVTAKVAFLQAYFKPHLSVFIQKIRLLYSHDISSAARKHFNGMQWDSAEINAAESVIWLLEQAEHPDVTIIALDAVPRLPPDLLLTLVKEREGLLERLIRFHNSLLPPRLSSNEGMESRPNTAVVSGLALYHIFKSQRPNHILNNVEALPLQSLNAFDIGDLKHEDDSVVIAKSFLSLHLSCIYHSPYDNMGQLSSLAEKLSPSLGRWTQLEVELSDARGGLTGSSFITSVFPFELVLDFIIRLAWEKPSFTQDSDSVLQSGWFVSDSEYFGRCLREIMMCLWWSLREDEEPSRNALGHLAIAVTAIFWSQKCADPWNYPSPAHEMQFEQLLISRCLAVDKSNVALENIALALSMIDSFDSDVFGTTYFDPKLFDPLFFGDSEFSMGPHIFHRLFKVASPLINAEIKHSGREILYPNFAQSLLRLSRQILLQDKETCVDIARNLVHCPNGDWLLPTGQMYSNDIARLLELLLYTDFNDNPVSSLLDKMAEFMSDLQFISIIDFIYPHHRSIAILPEPPTKFMGKALMLHEHNSSHPSVLLEIQISFAVAMVHHGTLSEICDFLNRIVQVDSELQWPLYFITAGIVPPNTLRNAEPPVLLRSIEYDHLSKLFRDWWDSRPNDVSHAWCGEALLLLWKKGRGECLKGGLPPDWNDSVFFIPLAVTIMLEYFTCIRLRGYTEINWDLVKEYFGRALNIVDREDNSFNRIEGIMQELDDYSNDHPPPPHKKTMLEAIWD